MKARSTSTISPSENIPNLATRYIREVQQQPAPATLFGTYQHLQRRGFLRDVLLALIFLLPEFGALAPLSAASFIQWS